MSLFRVTLTSYIGKTLRSFLSNENPRLLKELEEDVAISKDFKVGDILIVTGVRVIKRHNRTIKNFTLQKVRVRK